MRTRSLGDTALTVSELALGTAPLGNLYAEVSDEDAGAVIDAAWAGGIRSFDTAPHYGLGLAERRLGRALSSRPRGQFVLSTKVGRVLEVNPAPVGSDLAVDGYAVPDDLVRRRDYTRDGVRRSLHDSLTRLGLDRADVVYVHDAEQHMDVAIREAVPALVALREQGVIGAVGAGMNLVEPLRRFVAESDIDVVLVAGRLTLLDRSAEPLLADCASRGVAVVAAAPFNSGLLASDELADTHFDYGIAPADVLAAARECARVCTEHGTALPAAALQFALRRAGVACVLAGMRSAAEVGQDLDWYETPIPEALWDALPPPARG